MVEQRGFDEQRRVAVTVSSFFLGQVTSETALREWLSAQLQSHVDDD